MSKFKVGDRVRGNGGYSFDPIVGVVEEAYKNHYLVRAYESENLDDTRGRVWAYFEGNLELVKAKTLEWESGAIFSCKDPKSFFYDIQVQPEYLVSSSETRRLIKQAKDKQIKDKGGLMSKLRSVPTTLKRFLNQNYKAFYELHWVDEDLDLTYTGDKELRKFLFEHFEKELGEIAKKQVKEIKEEEEK